MTNEPERRADGLCACGCGKRLVTPVGTKQNPRLAMELTKEPFATSKCARDYYGVILSRPEGRATSGDGLKGARQRAWRKRQAAQRELQPEGVVGASHRSAESPRIVHKPRRSGAFSGSRTYADDLQIPGT